MTNSCLDVRPPSATGVPAANAQEVSGIGTNHRVQFTAVLTTSIRECGIDVTGTVLIVGGRYDDVAVLQRAGFRRMTLTNIESVSQFASGIPARGDVEVQIENSRCGTASLRRQFL
jgi:hypothetical protein